MFHVALPISGVDLQLARRLLGRLVSWKDEFPDQNFVVVATWEDHFDVQPLYTEFRSVFANTKWAVIEDVPEGDGWPDAANHLFRQTAGLMAGSPFYFMEADNVPLRPYFLDALNQEYEEAGKPYMGAIEPTRRTLPSGEYVERGKHMVGTGIYPADFLIKCKSIHHVAQGVPWDVYIEDEVVSECHETKLIAHRNGTAKYSLVNGILQCVDYKERPGKHSYADPVPRGALVIHGCKDFSLYDIDLSTY
jgi:hypothetical protein